MDTIAYDLLLKSPLGFMLLGTLRLRFSEPAAPMGVADVPALLAESLDRPFIQMDIKRLDGDIAIQFLSGARAVPIEGVSFSIPPAPLPLNGLFGSSDTTRPLFVQFSFLDATRIGGGLLWQPGTPRQQTFSLLGTQRPFGQ